MGIFSDIGGGIGNAIGSGIGLLGGYGEGGKDELEEITRLYRELDLPNFDLRDIDAPQLLEVAARSPELFQAHIEGQASLPEDSPEMRRSQLGNLAHFARMRDEGLPLGERLRGDELQREVAREASRARESSLQDLQRRGRLGGGAELAARMAGNQQASELARGLGSDLMRESVQNRLRGALAGADLGSNMRLQDISLSGQRADMLNRWNQMVSQMTTAANQQNAMARERSQAANVESRQGRADTNALNRYYADQQNQARQNTLAQQQFGNRMNRAGGIASGLGGESQAGYAEQAARRGNVTGLFGGLGQAAGGVADIAFPNVTPQAEDPRKRQGTSYNFFGSLV